MHSTPRLPSTEVKGEQDDVEEEDTDGLDLQKTEPVTIMNNQSIQNTVTTLKVRGEEARDGPICPMFSVTTTRSMGTMNENAERSKQNGTVEEKMSLKCSDQIRSDGGSEYDSHEFTWNLETIHHQIYSTS